MTGPAPTILTPTPRLARSLLHELAVEMNAAGRGAWMTPQVYSFSAWLARIREDYLLGSDDERIPIHADQALLLWQAQIDQDVFIGEPEVASLAQRAWRLLHEYQLDPPEQWPALLLSEDARRFREWSAAYQRACDRLGLLDEFTFAALLPRLLIERTITAPEQIELAGFELPMTPLQRDILAACEAAGSRITYRDSPGFSTAGFALRAFPDAVEELLGAARWARDRLQAEPAQHIAIVVPDLNGRVAQIERLFRQVFDPTSFSLGESGPEPWHISLGRPLTEWPLVADALAVLSLTEQRISQPDATVIVRSPFLAGWPEEADARNLALTTLTRNAPYDVTLRELIRILHHSGAQVLEERLTQWQRGREQSPMQAWPSQWVGIFQQELSRLGFGSGRPLDSREYQVLKRWHELLEAFGSLDLVAAAPLYRREAVAMIRQRAQAGVFRELNSGVPVEVLGVEEALGSRFDALWITTLDSDTWPGASQRNPLIPAALQADIPRATSDGALAQAQRELTGLRRAAPVICGSYALGSEEIVREPTRLLGVADLHFEAAVLPPEAAELAAPVIDATAPAFPGTDIRGGTGVLRDQSNCPFKAFAGRRLGAVELTPPRPGLDAGQRGTVIHLALERFWNDVHSRAELDQLTTDELSKRVTSAVDDALQEFTRRYLLTLSRAAVRLERRRTHRVVMRWLDIEKQRNEFTVISHEQPIELNIAGLRLSGKIDRLDRLSNGSTMLIDYKTGRAGKADWYPEPRIADPQLPAYAVAMSPAPGAISFAKIRSDELRFDGLAEGDAGTPGVTELAEAKRRFRDIDSWQALLMDWQSHLDGLAISFRQGLAAVDPRKSSVCATCHLHALCRIHERAPLASLAEDEPDD